MTFMKLIRGTLQLIGLCTVLTVVIGVLALFRLAAWFQYQDTPQKADYILPLAGDAHRLIEAARLYREGYASKILISKARVRPPTRFAKLRWELGYPKIDKVEFRLRLMALLGVPAGAMQPFGKGHISTVEEAEALRLFLGGRPGKIIIVTSAYHVRRAKLIFQDVMPGSIFLAVAPAEGRMKRRWWTHQFSAEQTIMETAKLAHYLLGGVFRSKPGH